VFIVKAAINTLRDVRHKWNMKDTWREANPTERAFTYRAQMHTNRIQAQLDCIYISAQAEPYTFEWEIKESAILTDHSIASVRYAPKDAPFIGKGRWMLPIHLLNNNELIEKIAACGIDLQSNMTRIRIKQVDRKNENAQMLWETYNKDIKKLAKETAKDNYHKITSCITAIEKDIRETNHNPDII